MNHSKPYWQNAEGVYLQQLKEEEPSGGNEKDARKACNFIRLQTLRKVTKRETS